MSGRVRNAVALLAVGLFAAACGGLPVGAGAHVVRAVGPAPAAPAPLREIPPGPTKGMSPADVVSGFLRAASDPQVADEYLAPGTTWDSDATSTVETSAGHKVAPAVATASGWKVQVQIPQQAIVGTDGVVRQAGGTVKREFSLVRSGNEWRISDLAPGSVYSLADLTVTRRLVTLNWIAPTSDVLVEEPVLLLTTAAQDPQVVAVHALLAGPPADLPVATAFPAGTRVNSVETEGTTVVVDLTASIAKASRAELAQATAQLAATLLPLASSSVTAVRIVADGLSVADAVNSGAADVARLDAESVVGAPVALVRHDDGVVESTTLAAATPATEPKATRSAPVAQSTDGHRSAWLQPQTDGTTVPTVAVAPDADPEGAAAAGHWSSLSFGRDSSLWLVAPGASGSVGTVVVIAPGEVPIAASIPAALQKITALHLSRDGVHGIAVAGGRLYGVTVRGGTHPAVVAADPLAPALTGVTVATAPTDGEVLAVGKVGSTTGVWEVATDIATSWQNGVLYPAPVAWGTPCTPTSKNVAVQPSDLAVPPTGAALGVLAVCDGVVRAEPAVASGTSVLQPSGAWTDLGPGGGVAWPGG